MIVARTVRRLARAGDLGVVARGLIWGDPLSAGLHIRLRATTSGVLARSRRKRGRKHSGKAGLVASWTVHAKVKRSVDVYAT